MIRAAEAGHSLLVYTDLDGTLLDAETYSYSAAADGLKALKEFKIPIILTTSKTKAEVERIREALGIEAPFITENGGGIYIPQGYFRFPFSYDRATSDYLIVELGTPHSTLLEALKGIGSETGVPVTGISDMSPEEVSERTGLPVESAILAKMREYDEPFLYGGDENNLIEAAKKRGLTITKGSRFFHLTGNNNKGTAVRRLADIFRRLYDHLKTIAIGDSSNDRSMLEAVNIPVIVKKSDHTYESSIDIPGLVYARGVGPIGWNNAILEILKKRP